MSKGYRTLSDPTQRLLHLLTLEDAPATNAQAVLSDLADLFLTIGGLNQQIDLVLETGDATAASEINAHQGMTKCKRVKDQLERLRGT